VDDSFRECFRRKGVAVLAVHGTQGVLSFGEVAVEEAFHVFEKGEEGLDSGSVAMRSARSIPAGVSVFIFGKPMSFCICL
jgi:hypothetical protein